MDGGKAALKPATVLLWLALISGCTTTYDTLARPDHRPLQAPYRILLMPVHARVGEATARMDFVPNAEWEEAARVHLMDAVHRHQSDRGADVTVLDPARLGDAEQQRIHQLLLLHGAVGRSILQHRIMGQKLATKRHPIDWSLGGAAVEIGALTGLEQALFVFVHDAFGTTGFKTVQAAALSVCIVGPCVLLLGPMQVAFVSLVDLQTGDLLWFNRVEAMFGDVRTAEGAETLVGKLLTGLDAEHDVVHAH